MKTQILVTSLVTLLCIACTKKDSDANTHTEKKTLDSQIQKVPNSDDCFKLALNKEFSLNDHDSTQIRIVPTTFNDKKAIAIEKQTGGIKSATIYDETGRTELADQSYGTQELGTDPNTIVSVTHYKAPLPSYPSNLKPNQKFKITYDTVTTSTKDREETKSNISMDITFLGFEDLNFIDASDQKLAFKNVCHFTSSVSADSKDKAMVDGTTDIWIAEGFGTIRTVVKTKQGEILFDDAIGDEPQP